jgi:hypothetical protein
MQVLQSELFRSRMRFVQRLPIARASNVTLIRTIAIVMMSTIAASFPSGREIAAGLSWYFFQDGLL